MDNNIFLLITGNIATGKSTLSDLLAKELGYKWFEEPFMDNPYLPLVYRDPKRWSYHSQTYFLLKHFQQHKQIEGEKGGIIKDCTIYEAKEIFARNYYNLGYISETDWKVYCEFYNILNNDLIRPDLIIYLKCNLEKLMERIKKRNRPFESSITLEDLRRIELLYEDLIRRIPPEKLLVIDENEIDFVKNKLAYIELIDVIRERINIVQVSKIKRRKDARRGMDVGTYVELIKSNNIDLICQEIINLGELIDSDIEKQSMLYKCFEYNEEYNVKEFNTQTCVAACVWGDIGNSMDPYQRKEKYNRLKESCNKLGLNYDLVTNMGNKSLKAINYLHTLKM